MSSQGLANDMIVAELVEMIKGPCCPPTLVCGEEKLELHAARLGLVPKTAVTGLAWRDLFVSCTCTKVP